MDSEEADKINAVSKFLQGVQSVGIAFMAWFLLQSYVELTQLREEFYRYKTQSLVTDANHETRLDYLEGQGN